MTESDWFRAACTVEADRFQTVRDYGCIVLWFAIQLAAAPQFTHCLFCSIRVAQLDKELIGCDMYLQHILLQAPELPAYLWNTLAIWTRHISSNVKKERRIL